MATKRTSKEVIDSDIDDEVEPPKKRRKQTRKKEKSKSKSKSKSKTKSKQDKQVRTAAPGDPLNVKEPNLYASTRQEWREWLEKNHDSEEYNKGGIWLILTKVKYIEEFPSVSYEEARDEVLCFGWIDSRKYSRNDKSYYIYMTKRKAKSQWSRVNKERIKVLTKDGLMHESGLKCVKNAQKSGSWDLLNKIDNLEMPPGLMDEFTKYPNSLKNWNKFSNSVKRNFLFWVYNAKKEETRNKRISQTAKMANENKKLF